MNDSVHRIPEHRIEDTHPWSETHVSVSRSRSRGARTKQGTCSTCSPWSARSNPHSVPLDHRTIYECHRVYEAHRKSMRNFVAPPTFALAAQNPVSLERNTVGHSTPHHRVACSTFISFPPFFVVVLLLLLLLYVPAWTKGREEKMERGEGGWIFASEGTVAWDPFTCP